MQAEIVKEAAELCERTGIEITVANVAANVRINPGEYSRIFGRGLKIEVGAALKRAGYITNDETTNSKVDIADASLSDLQALLRIKRKNARRVQVQVDALQMLVDFLEAKESELGYEPYVRLFENDARRIYAMHGLDLPKDWDKA